MVATVKWLFLRNSLCVRTYRCKMSPEGTAELIPGLRPTSVDLFGVFFSNLPQNRHPERSASQIYRVVHRLGAESKDLEGRLSYSCRWHPFNHRSPHLADPPRFEEFAQTWGWKMITVHEKMYP